MTVGTAASTKTWHLPKELLTNSSPFFAAALDGSFAEATSKVVQLPEDNTDAFALFIRWLYVGEIAAIERSASHDHDQDHLCIAATFQTLLQAWMLGDKLGCPIFKDLAMLDLMKFLDLGVMNTNTVRSVYERSTPGSNLRKFFLDQGRHDAWADRLGDGADEWINLARDCVDFGEDSIKATFQKDKITAIKTSEQKGLCLEVLTVKTSCV